MTMAGVRRSRPMRCPRARGGPVFQDDGLNALEPQIQTANQSLRVADANLQQARSQIRVNRADLFPTIGTAPFAGAERYSANRPYFTAANANSGLGDFQLPGDVSWELDLFGRIRRTVNIAKEEAQASEADLQNTLLSLQSELAMDYFEVRAADAQRKLLDDTVAQYQEALRVTNNRFVGGVAPKSDVSQAETQLQAALVLASDVEIRRAQYEHAIAVLVGVPPASFALGRAPLNARPPAIPPGAAFGAAGAATGHCGGGAPDCRGEPADRDCARSVLSDAVALRAGRV